MSYERETDAGVYFSEIDERDGGFTIAKSEYLGEGKKDGCIRG